MKNHIKTLLIIPFLAIPALAVVFSNAKEETLVDAWSGKQTSNCPANYYSQCEGKEGTTLKTTLKSINMTGISKSYDWSRYEACDEAENSSTSILSLYTRHNIPKSGHCPPYSWTTWNREHIWVQSKYTQSTTDNHNIFACEGQINGYRSNYPFGEVSHSGTELSVHGNKTGCYLSGGRFEPNDDSKGEVARSLMYGAAMYDYTLTEMISVENALKWHLEHPVTDRDIFRNNTVYNQQHNRNPFVDHPEYACRIWGNTSAATKSLCSGQPEPEPSITITNKPTLPLEVGDKYTLTCSTEGSGTLAFASSNPSIATVSNIGVITAVAVGSATITATYGTASDTATITVSQKVEPTVSITNKISSLKVGESHQLQVNKTGSGTLSYSSSDSLVANISSSGNIYAMKAGTCQITVTLGSASDFFDLTVTETPSPSEVTITITNLKKEINVGESYQLNVATTGEADRVVFYSSNKEVATISETGVIAAIKEGTSVIRATYGTAVADFTLTVKAVSKKGCGGSIATTSILLSFLSVAALGLIFTGRSLRKRKSK